MITLPVLFTISTMTLNQEQLDKLKSQYVEMIIDGMDHKTIFQFAYDTIMQDIEKWDEQDVKEEILDCYDEEMWQDLVEASK